MSEEKLFKGDYNLFDNPMVRSARSSMTKEDLERYQDWGHAVFDDIDYETGNINQYPPPMINALAYIESSLKSGQHPSTLNEDEINILNEMKGNKWYEKWGYVEGDLTDIVTIKIEK